MRRCLHAPITRLLDSARLVRLVAATSLVAASMAASCPAVADAASDQDESPPVKLVVDPMPAPREALRYQLLPPLLDRRAGDAATLYNKVSCERHVLFGDEEFWDQVKQWVALPLDEFPREEARNRVNGLSQVYEQLDRAARRAHCDWQLPIREHEYLSILLPEFQQARQYAWLLALRARVESVEGRFDEAVRTLQTGFAIARHVSQAEVLVCTMVGVAIARMMSDRVEDLIAQPGGPNVYWALTWLPRPVVDLRPAMEGEMYSLYLTFPELQELDQEHSPEYWRDLLHRLAEWSSHLDGGPPLEYRPVLTAMVIDGYPRAKEYLIQTGRSREEVEAMPVPQVVVLYTAQTYNEFRDEMFKWCTLPNWQAAPGLDAAQDDLKRHGKEREILPLAYELLPAMTSVKAAVARNERHMAMLRIIEAIRMYGAAHDGRLPRTLSEITEVPVPVDPMTGRPFVYRLAGESALLEAPSEPGERPRYYYRPRRYEIEFRH